ncbi:hypothetical protein Tco_0497355 [Tanacetum coccineum]
MSDSEHSTVTYTSVSIPVEDDSDIGSPGINGPPIMPEDPYAYIMAAYEVPPSPDYIPGPEVPPSPDYIPGPEVPPSPDYIPGPEVSPSPDYIPGPEELQLPPPLDFVPELMYPEYMPQEDEILPTEEQPLPTAASPTADSPGYVPESDPELEPEEDNEDPEEDPADYPADRDDDDDEDEDEDEEEEEEHPALAYYVPPVHRMTARISIRDEPSISLPPREEIPSPPPNSLTHIEILENCLPLRKRVRFASPTPSREVGESSAAGAARHDRPTIAKGVLYGFVGYEPSMIIAPRSNAPQRRGGSISRVTDLATIVEEETFDMYGIMGDAQDERSLLSVAREALGHLWILANYRAARSAACIVHYYYCICIECIDFRVTVIPLQITRYRGLSLRVLASDHNRQNVQLD